MATDVPLEKRRVLKKVRRNFINKTPEEPEAPAPNQDTIASIPSHLKPDSFNIIDPYFGIVEKNRKLYYGFYYVQSNFNLTHFSFNERETTGAVIINIQKKESDRLMSFREIGIKRLESYGDLNFATVGWKLKNRYTTYPNYMQKYFGLMNSGDPNVLASFRRAKSQAALLMKEIESKYAYKKSLHFFEKSSSRKLSLSYSHKLIQEIGYSIDEFVNLIQNDGLPCIFKGDSSLCLDKMQGALDYSISDQDKIYERPEYKVHIFGKGDIKKLVTAQSMAIAEPTTEGVFVSVYLLIKRVEESNGKEVPSGHVEEVNLKMRKIAEEEHDDESQKLKISFDVKG